MSGEDEMLVLVEEAEILCAKYSFMSNAFHLLMQSMYKLELIKDKHVEDWGEQAKKSIESHDKKLLSK